MKTNMKIVFFGTSDRSIPILNSLKQNFHLLLCVTKADTKIGRKQEIKESGVKKWAKENSISYIEVDNFKQNNLSAVIDQLNYSKPEYGVVCDFSFIIPNEIIEWFKGKLINIHFSLLPKYRGASPVQLAILNGDKTTGISYQLVHKEMDKGAIIKQIEYKTSGKETCSELSSTLFKIASENLPSVLTQYDNLTLKPKDQNETLATYTFSKTNPKSTLISKEDSQIFWNEPAEVLERKVRAYNPWPIVWIYLKDLPFELKENVKPELKLKIFSVGIKNGKFEPIEVQVEGKSKISWKEFRNGYTKN